MKAENEAFKKAMPPEYPIAAGLADVKDPSDLKIFLRGNPYAFGEDAPRAFLQVLSDGEPKPFSKGSGRMELAEDIVKQPLAMRVFVNRIWRWNMGTGIVDTPNNFGFAGERPTNPELLEYLTSKFVDEGMSPKKLIKEIVMSRTYQLSSAPSQDESREGSGQPALLARKPAAPGSRRNLGRSALRLRQARHGEGRRPQSRVGCEDGSPRNVRRC